ncbi:hypothetical protein Q3G72_013133 [Acer saccharum]|nr:hypothetical protein Q3G72_013133 [Acer saccharum]
MGRYSRFIAMYATLAIRDVDCCLIPKSQFYLEGPGGHMVIVIAEGAGQCKHTMDQQDASTKLFQDADLCIYQKMSPSTMELIISVSILDITKHRRTGNRKTDQGGEKASVINQSAKLLGSKQYQQMQNRGIIRDQTKLSRH